MVAFVAVAEAVVESVEFAVVVVAVYRKAERFVGRIAACLSDRDLMRESQSVVFGSAAVVHCSHQILRQ